MKQDLNPCFDLSDGPKPTQRIGLPGLYIPLSWNHMTAKNTANVGDSMCVVHNILTLFWIYSLESFEVKMCYWLIIIIWLVMTLIKHKI